MDDKDRLNIYAITAKAILFNNEQIFISCRTKIRFDEIINILIDKIPDSLVAGIERREKEFSITLTNGSEICCKILENQMEIVRGKRVDMFSWDDYSDITEEDWKEIFSNFIEVK